MRQVKIVTVCFFLFSLSIRIKQTVFRVEHCVCTRLGADTLISLTHSHILTLRHILATFNNPCIPMGVQSRKCNRRNEKKPSAMALFRVILIAFIATRMNFKHIDFAIFKTTLCTQAISMKPNHSQHLHQRTDYFPHLPSSFRHQIVRKCLEAFGRIKCSLSRCLCFNFLGIKFKSARSRALRTEG